MKKRDKIIALLLCLIIAFSLGACGKATDNDKNNDSDKAPAGD